MQAILSDRLRNRRLATFCGRVLCPFETESQILEEVWRILDDAYDLVFNHPYTRDLVVPGPEQHIGIMTVKILDRPWMRDAFGEGTCVFFRQLIEQCWPEIRLIAALTLVADRVRGGEDRVGENSELNVLNIIRDDLYELDLGMMILRIRVDVQDE
ncbi:hypothetical protein VTN77DRAFT_3230 [Rasamsonia byssochlamydoides]|uniref:uncharacterized protein n=1 Tax=Rasamsonia byssochlamydoides TaxID=89139 RepID=UPI003744A832